MWSTIIEGEGLEQSLTPFSQSMVKPGEGGGGDLKKEKVEGEEGYGCDSSIWSPLGNYRLSRRPKSQRLNKEMKRNLRKMDEPPGKHPPFSPLLYCR